MHLPAWNRKYPSRSASSREEPPQYEGEAESHSIGEAQPAQPAQATVLRYGLLVPVPGVSFGAEILGEFVDGMCDVRGEHAGSE